MALSTIGLIIPAIFHSIVSGQPEAHEQELSLEIAIVLFVCYILSLVFSLRTHSHLYVGEASPESEEALAEALGGDSWSQKKSLIVLLVATSLVAVMSELLVGAVEHTAKAWGLSDVFIGVVLVAIVGNAAEHSTAVMMAMKNKMDLAINIAIGSSIQIALFVAPVLVFCGYLFDQPMNLLFTNFEVLAVAISAWIVVLITSDGESNWMEGVMLLAVYLILGLAFFFLPG